MSKVTEEDLEDFKEYEAATKIYNEIRKRVAEKCLDSVLDEKKYTPLKEYIKTGQSTVFTREAILNEFIKGPNDRSLFGDLVHDLQLNVHMDEEFKEADKQYKQKIPKDMMNIIEVLNLSKKHTITEREWKTLPKSLQKLFNESTVQEKNQNQRLYNVVAYKHKGGRRVTRRNKQKIARRRK